MEEIRYERQPPGATTSLVRAKMQKQRIRDTKPEVLLRRALHARGVRFRVNGKLPALPRRTVDLVWKNRRIAVFVDGCFWHGCEQHFVLPKSHSDWWAEKIRRNKERDRETSDRLVANGWMVIRIWEHVPPEDAADAVQRALSRPLGGVFIVS